MEPGAGAIMVMDFFVRQQADGASAAADNDPKNLDAVLNNSSYSVGRQIQFWRR